MNNICTSLEQSKKLIELGIDVYTADMFYPNAPSPVPCVDDGNPKGDVYIPAWSLTALFDLLPEHTRVPSSLKQNKYMCNYHNDIVEFGDDYHEDKSTNLFDGVFQIIVWLKENGKI